MSTQQTFVVSAPGSAGPLLLLRVVRDHPIVVIEMCGEIDMSTAHLVTNLVDDVVGHRPARVVLDMANVSFFGAAGVHALLHAHERVTAVGGSLLLRTPSACTRQVLTLTGTDRVLPFDAVAVRDVPMA
jgi:anti-anti-sigma factor